MLLCCLAITQGVWAQGIIREAFSETFSKCSGTGGRDNSYSGNVGLNKIIFDSSNEEDMELQWINYNDKVWSAKECMKFGTGSVDASITTTDIILIDVSKKATLTFEAAGWASGTLELRVKANEGVTLTGDTQIALTASQWTSYKVDIDLGTAKTLRLTFEGRRGFLDNIKVQEEVKNLATPTLPEAFEFWGNTTEEATKGINLTPQVGTSIRYTTDGSTPTLTNGHDVTLPSLITITGTTTLKAISYYEKITSDMVETTYTVGQTVSSIAEFVQLSEGKEARLFLSDEMMARVLNVNEKQFLMKDNTGTLLVNFGDAPYNPTPAKDMHLAGWIVGQRTTIGGQPAMVATHNTNAHYMAFANPVTETPTAVKSIQRQQADEEVEYYNLAGQRVAQPAKGVYITNGKKEVRK